VLLASWSLMLKKRFRVLLKGRRVLLRLEGSEHPSLFGYYATRVVSAADESAARGAALDRVRSDLDALGARSEQNASDGQHRPEILELTEVSRFRLGDIKGFTFFPEPIDN
jgi:hypothetical protein